MAPQTDKMAECQNNTDTLCKSTPRFAFWPNLEPDGIPPFFNPPLKYNPDSGGGEGADVDPLVVIDKKPYDKGATFVVSCRNRMKSPAKSANRNPSHLIITDFPSHSAKVLCDHPNSHGWDTVSTITGRVKALIASILSLSVVQVCTIQTYH